MASNFEVPQVSSSKNSSNGYSSSSAPLGDDIQALTASNEILSTSNVRTPTRSYRRHTSSESSLNSNDEHSNYYYKERNQRTKKEKKALLREKLRYAISSSSSSGEVRNSNTTTGRDFVNRRSDISPPVPYFRDQSRERSRMRRIKESTESPSRTSRGRSRTSNDLSGMRPRRRPQTPPTPKKQKEKNPHFREAVREKDRLRRQYKSPSPIVRSNRHRSSKSRTLRRHRSRSRSCSRSRSKSRDRKSRSDHYRHNRDTWPTAPQIITVPVPVPDYSFSVPPYHLLHEWPHLPIRPARFSCFSHHYHQNSRRSRFNATSLAVPSSYPPMPPIRYMAPSPIWHSKSKSYATL